MKSTCEQDTQAEGEDKTRQDTFNRHGQSRTNLSRFPQPPLAWGNLQVQQTENRIEHPPSLSIFLSFYMLLISRYLFAAKADNFDISLTKVSPCENFCTEIAKSPAITTPTKTERDRERESASLH